MMSSSDLFIEGYPHGTPQGYDDGCRGAVCPAGIEHGLSCKIAKQKSRGDYQYQQLVKKGATLAEIADALGLVTHDPGAPKPKKPTPATARGGRSLAAAAETATADENLDEAVDEIDAPTTETPEPPRMNVHESVATGNASGTAGVGTDEQPAPTPREIRQWAVDRGYEISSKGKIPQYVIDHYWEATGRLDTTDEQAPINNTDPQKPAETRAGEHETSPTDQLTVNKTSTPPDDRPDWGHVALLEDLEAARNLACRLEQELARSEEQRETERTERAEMLRYYADALTTARETQSELVAAAEAERDSANHALELAVRKWGDERAANEASYAVILEQAATINHLVEQQHRGTPTTSDALEDHILHELVNTSEIQDPTTKTHERHRLLTQFSRLGSGKARTR